MLALPILTYIKDENNLIEVLLASQFRNTFDMCKKPLSIFLKNKLFLFFFQLRLNSRRKRRSAARSTRRKANVAVLVR